MKTLLFTLLIFSVSFIFSQKVQSVVVNENKKIIQNATVKNPATGEEVFTNIEGSFKIESAKNTLLAISYFGYTTAYLNATEIKDTIQLLPDPRFLNNVVINYSAIHPILDSLNLNVLDYLPFKDYTLVLYRLKRKNYVSFIYPNKPSKIFPINLNANSFVEDCFGNIHLITKKYAHLIHTTSTTFEQVDSMSIKQFENLVKPCVAQLKTSYFKQEYTMHNKVYKLGVKKRGELNYKPIYTIKDEKELIAAQKMYSEIISLYYYSTGDVDNIILNKAWSGNILELGFNYELISLIGFYKKILSKPIKVEVFKSNEDVLLFDLIFDSLSIFNSTGVITHKTTVEFNKRESKPIEILMDKAKNKFYAIYLNEGIYSLNEIEIKQGKLLPTYYLKDVPFPENLKIFDNHVYFIRKNNGYGKLYKTKI